VVEQLQGSTWTVIAKLGSGTMSYAVGGLSAASTTSFRVAGTNQAGTGAFLERSALTWPAAPTNFVSTTNSPSQITLSWNAVGGATGYVVEYKTPTSVWTTLKTLAVGQTSLVVTLTPGAAYSFDVGASNAAGTTFANPINVTTQNGVPATPTNFAAEEISNTQVELTWSPVAGATAYVISQYTSSGWVTLTTTANDYIYINVTAGYTCEFDVQAANSAGTSEGAPPQIVTVS
jgi:hypothetical protein